LGCFSTKYCNTGIWKESVKTASITFGAWCFAGATAEQVICEDWQRIEMTEDVSIRFDDVELVLQLFVLQVHRIEILIKYKNRIQSIRK
jgi:hypothetical protein